MFLFFKISLFLPGMTFLGGKGRPDDRTFPFEAGTSTLFGTFVLEIELVISEEDVVPFIWFSCSL